MLLKSSITKIRIHSEEWYQARLGKFTSSEMHLLMGKTFPTKQAQNWIFRKVGEEISGLPCRDDIDTNATKHGNLYEPEAIKLFLEMNNFSFCVTQCLISPEGSRFSGTPDALILLKETQDCYEVEPMEAKCPYSFDAYIKLFMCNNALDVLETEDKYFWQVIDQMQLTDALKGHLVIYQPMFKAGKIKIITFRKLELLSFFNALKERKKQAEDLFLKTRDKLLAA